MRKSRTISLTLMAGLAAACSGGNARDTASAEWGSGDAAQSRFCADSTGRVVPDEECARPRTVSGGGIYPFMYYYGATRLMRPNGQAYIQGGRASTVGVGSGRVLAPARGPVSRGGFGARSAGRSGSFGG